MVKWFMALPLLMLALQASADVNTDVANCLSSGNNTAGGKSTCIQAAIAKEETNQINTFFQIYANGVNQSISYYQATPGGNTPSSIGNTSGASTNLSGGGVNAGQPRTPPPTVTPGQTQSAPQAPASPAKSPQNPGGIQYY